jgi:transcriptional regulator with XRE-family HTH domain
MVRRRKKLSFGQAIGELRRSRGLNQRDLAARVHKENGTPISQQYLNDIENDRRNPSSTILIGELAKALGVEPAYLSYVAGLLPQELHGLTEDAEELRRAIDAFQAALGRSRLRQI